jgi:Cysteine-rich secretory protein family
MRSSLPTIFGLVFAACSSAIAQPAPSHPTEMISNYRLQHGEGKVTSDPVLIRIAHEQARAMAAKDTLDHSVLGPFNSRVASSGSDHAAENIAFGYDTFAKTLDQWIDSAGHRRNLLMHGASRVGVASAQSPTTGRIYWAMVIAGDYKTKSKGKSKSKITPAEAEKHSASRQVCRISILNLCL